MKRVFFATRPDLICRVIPEWYKSYSQAVECFVTYPLVGIKAVPYMPGGIFEPLGQDHSLFLVNDGHKDDLLAELVIGSDDYLIYHENTLNPIINEHFLTENRMASIHEEDPSLSKYAQAFAIIQENGLQKAERIIDAVFPQKRMIESFLSCLYDKVPPTLPDVLSSLKAKYEQLLQTGQDKVKYADQWQSFVEQCIEIHDHIK